MVNNEYTLKDALVALKKERQENNKHIIEFAREAGIIGESETTVAPTILKFAELIVKECALTCYNTLEVCTAYELADYFGFEFNFKQLLQDEEDEE